MKTIRTSVRALLAVLALLTGAGATVLAGAAPAFAHAQLVSSDPKNGDTLAEAPATAVLVFSERLDAPSTQLALTNDRGAVVPTKPFAVDGEKLTVPLDLPAAGLYTLGYRLVSEDGHRVDGKVTFTVRAGTPGSTNTPTQAAPDKGVSGNADGTDQGAGEDGAGGSSTIYWLLGGLALVVVVVLVAVLARRRPSPRT